MLLLFVFIVGPVSDLKPGFRAFIDIFLGVVLVSGIQATIKKSSAIFAVTLVALAIGSSLIRIPYHDNFAFKVASELFHVFAVGLFLYVVSAQVMKEGPITADRVRGAVASYLLIAILWAKLYALFLLLIPTSFSGIESADDFGALLYFSVVTLTTVGYGDILPTHVSTRTFANAEALIGQLFPAIFIARLVGLQVDQHRHHS